MHGVMRIVSAPSVSVILTPENLEACVYKEKAILGQRM